MSEKHQWQWRAGRDPNLRAADADREAVAEQLRRSHGEGRLDTNEFQQRIDRCYQAKTLGELNELTSDLPPQRSGEEQAPNPPFARRYLRRLPVGVVPLLILFLVLSAASGHGHGHAFWLVIPLFFLITRLCWWRRRRWGFGGRGGWRTEEWL